MQGRSSVSAAEQLTLDGRAVPHDVVVRGPSTSRMVRRALLPKSDGIGYVLPPELAEYVAKIEAALDRADVRPGEAFYVSRVPPPPRSLGNDARGGVHRGDPATSHAAAERNRVVRGGQARAVLRAVLDAGERGLNADEAARVTGLPSTPSGNSAAKRLSELKRDGLVESLGQTRATEAGASGVVYVATLAGHSAMEAAR
jgi:hypothetical protein